MAGNRKKTFDAKWARIFVLIFLVCGILLGIFDVPGYWNKLVAKVSQKTKLNAVNYLSLTSPILIPYRFGLDVQGGTHLVYQADLSKISGSEQSSSMEGVRNVIERRVNLFGVAEPLIQVEKSGQDWRLIVELAGIKDINSAIRLIGETPFLEFKEEVPPAEGNKTLQTLLGEKAKDVKAEALCAPQNVPTLTIVLQQYGVDPCYRSTELTGRFVKNAQLVFNQTSYKPYINLELTNEGSKIFADLTKKNKGKRLAIYLDGAPISTPVVQEEITGGKAQISGSFTPDEAKQLVERLNAGALPVPIKLIAQQSVEASLGKESLERTLNAGIIGFLAVAFFMILWYRLPGVIAVLALLFYIATVLTIFKLIPVTLTIAGIAGFILSIGMAVDANILIFERFKEERKQGKPLEEAIREGFSRAWTSIRDSNISSLITSSILYWLGTSVVRGFALTLSIGILVSMFTAISVTRTLLIAILSRRLERFKSLFLSGMSR